MAVISQLLRERHAYYRTLLAVEVLALVSLRALQHAPRLVGLVYLVIAGTNVLMASPLLPQHRLKRTESEKSSAPLSRYLRRVFLRRKLILVGWLAALVIEVVWQAALVWDPALAVQLSAPHLVIWLVLMLEMLWGLVNSLAAEPLFNGDLLMGAAAGYLLVGFIGGVVLNSLLVLEPAAFNLAARPSNLPDGIRHAPAILGASFASLTTLGSPLLKAGSLTSLTGSVAITIVGQLYLAIIIAGVLGKPRQKKAAARSEHPLGQRASALRRIGPNRR
ncbi:hypothetical protein KBY58_02145 [Cyanobium sp. HWJ4-Hawea]|uniref:hypothetical protein n=1 Tax=Cyanobium sp. HWJ4-Hawea TaxID=2823713 RepID=UPI0020CCEA5C|nr:hypothetical protein [Cyanobium sp. HWJ4-Hawea]MCP9808233.1 hypothetical protein [Cyanobium sp. HWJ4-Hawea]